MTPHTMSDTIERKYWTIGQVAELVGVKAFRLRIWESKYKMKVKRDHKNERLYTREDICTLEIIRDLRRMKK